MTRHRHARAHFVPVCRIVASGGKDADVRKRANLRRASPGRGGRKRKQPAAWSISTTKPPPVPPPQPCDNPKTAGATATALCQP
eukprot:139821-Chlamydomonas_euryale.AAC.1